MKLCRITNLMLGQGLFTQPRKKSILQHPKQHLRVARRPAAQRQVPNFSRFLFLNTKYQLYMTILKQSQQPECISKRPESHLTAAREHLTAAREHLLVANEQSHRPARISKWPEGLFFNYILVHTDQFAAIYYNLQHPKNLTWAKDLLKAAREYFKAAREHLTAA